MCLHLQWVISPTSINIKGHIQPTRCHITGFFNEDPKHCTLHFCSCCYCRPLLSNPLLQFPQRVEAPPFPQGPCLGLAAVLTHGEARYAPRNDSACSVSTVPRRVFTSGTWILQIRGYRRGRVLGVGARQQRWSLVHVVGRHGVNREKRRGEEATEAAGWHRLFTEEEEQPGAGLSVPCCSRSGRSPSDDSLEEEELHGDSPPHSDVTRGGLWIHTGRCDGILYEMHV